MIKFRTNLKGLNEISKGDTTIQLSDNEVISLKDQIGEIGGKGELNSDTELNKIKVVLCALWDNQPHPEAERIIHQFNKEIDEIERG